MRATPPAEACAPFHHAQRARPAGASERRVCGPKRPCSHDGAGGGEGGGRGEDEGEGEGTGVFEGACEGDGDGEGEGGEGEGEREREVRVRMERRAFEPLSPPVP